MRRPTALGWAMLAIIGATGAAAQTAPLKGGALADPALTLPLEGVRTDPDWRAKPTGKDIEREYPVIPRIMGIGGRAAVTCTAEPDGRIDECRVVSEQPSGLGFGAATVRSSKYFIMKPATLDGVPIRSEVTIPLRFQQEPQPEPPTPTLAQPSPVTLALARRALELSGVRPREQTAIEQQLGQLTQGVAIDTHPADAQLAIDSLRQAMLETMDEEVERIAIRQAVSLGEAQLTQIVAFLESPAGRAWNTIASAGDALERPSFSARVSARARARFCAKVACEADAPSAAASSAPAKPKS